MIAVVLALGGAIGAEAYALLADRWADGTITMHLQLGASGRLTDGSASWGDSAEAALADWNQYVSRVQFRVVRDSTVAKGDGNNINNVFFSNDAYGMSFDPGTLALTTNWFRGTRRVEADVIFNASSQSWDSYSGPLGRNTHDFRRIALHEFGHVLGLDHPDERGQAASAIMNSRTSDLDHLTGDDVAGVQALYPNTPSSGGSGGGSGAVSFPPRNESLDFRSQLEAKYRDGLRRGATSTYVDVEGDIVWTQEYLRYRVNQCSHQQAIDRVMAQIDGGSAAGVCGAAEGQVLFPPRNEPLDFRNRLEAKYRDGLRRSPTSTSVDKEGDVVWTQEYLRYRVNGCGHALAVQNVLVQIDGRPTPAVCR